MGKQGYLTELQRALARPDAEKMCQQVDAFIDYFAGGAGDWPDDKADDFEEIVACHHDDPQKAWAYVVLAASRSDDPAFLGYVGCGPLEDILRNPSAELLGRVVAEARKSARFRWLLSHPFKAAIAERAWEAIKGLRTTGPSEEPSPDALPPRQVN
jgi:hypothetical protein